jgi:hypothetical protein
MPKVYNKHHGDAPSDAVYVGRGSVWGNPYPITASVSREKSLSMYETYLKKHPKFVEKIKKELNGKDLVCFCVPKVCHADILLRISNE